jgi:hypothetical protein
VWTGTLNFVPLFLHAVAVETEDDHKSDNDRSNDNLPDIDAEWHPDPLNTVDEEWPPPDPMNDVDDVPPAAPSLK